MKNFKVVLTVFLAGSLALASQAFAKEDDSSNQAATGAVVGAGTNVLAGAALDSLTGSSQTTVDPNKAILKQAVQGAITGAVAAGVAGGEDKGSGESVTSTATTIATNVTPKNKKWDKHKKTKEGHHPPGWDRGKKVGWGEGDTPPGLRKGHDSNEQGENEGQEHWKDKDKHIEKHRKDND